MKTESVSKYFTRIGARLVVRHTPRAARAFDLNIRKDKKGEHFTLAVRDAETDIRVLQANRLGRHLLLFAKASDAAPHATGERFLCGHDERHWFVAKVDERVSTVTEAKRALLPQELKDAGLTADDLARRRSAKFKRQGEWFFIPVTDVGTLATVLAAPVLHGEPLMRARGRKPHIPAELVRFGGQAVWVAGSREYSQSEWEALLRAGGPIPRARQMVKNPEVYVRGSVRHPDHATLSLLEWHRVFPNREGSSLNLSFYD